MTQFHSRTELLSALERGDAALLEEAPDAVARAQSLLAGADPSDAEGLSDALVSLVAAHAIEHGRADFLARALEGPRSLAKQVKKALYQRRSEGRPIALPKLANAAARARSTEVVLGCFLSPVDLDGRRTFVAPHAGPHGFEAVLGELDDVTGLVRVDLAPLPRREYRRFARELSRGAGRAPWIELTAAELGGVIAAARALRANSSAEPAGTTVLGRMFPGEPTAAASRQWPAEPDHDAQRLRQSAQLFAHAENARWMPSNEALALLGRRIDEVATSRLVVNEPQRRAQIEAALDRTVADYFDASVRARWSERLFQQADFFARTGRPEPAALAATTARALEGELPTADIAFARALFQKALLEQTEAAVADLTPAQRDALEREERANEQPQASTPEPLIVPGR